MLTIISGGSFLLAFTWSIRLRVSMMYVYHNVDESTHWLITNNDGTKEIHPKTKGEGADGEVT